MKKKKKKVISYIREMINAGTLEPEASTKLEKAIKDLDHALFVGDRREIRAAVDAVAGAVLRVEHLW